MNFERCKDTKIMCIFAKNILSIITMNKIVLITGATSGIGLGCAKKFAANGDKLILTGRNEQRLEEIRKELSDKGTQVLTLVFDVRNREDATRCINSLPAEWKEIDVPSKTRRGCTSLPSS